MARILYYVPVIHAPEELGTLKDQFLESQKQAYGEEQARELVDAIGKYWEEAERRIQERRLFLPARASGLHVFVDGLPNVDEALVQKVLQDLFALRSPMYRLVERFLQAGARVHGTEDVTLLLREYEYWQAIAQNSRAPDPVTEREILKARDAAIARRVSEITRDGECAILFVGKLHDVVGKIVQLDPSFTVIHL